jgi:prevent-host-death family protein
MEKSYGIEAARAKLGDIADHVRDTGQVIPLTRHGRTVAVIGPAGAAKPAGGVEVTMYFPLFLRHTVQLPDLYRRTCVLPALPRVGERFCEEVALGPDDAMEAQWDVASVDWCMRADGSAFVGVSLEPIDEATEELLPERLKRMRAGLPANTYDDE